MSTSQEREYNIIENTLGLSIALIDVRKQKKIGNKILLCRNKLYSSDSGFESMEKYMLDETLSSQGYKVELFFWDSDCSFFINQVKLWMKIRSLNPWIIFFSSYSVRRKRPAVQPSRKYLEILRSKIKSNIIE